MGAGIIRGAMIVAWPSSHGWLRVPSWPGNPTRPARRAATVPTRRNRAVRASRRRGRPAPGHGRHRRLSRRLRASASAARPASIRTRLAVKGRPPHRMGPATRRRAPPAGPRAIAAGATARAGRAAGGEPHPLALPIPVPLPPAPLSPVLPIQGPARSPMPRRLAPPMETGPRPTNWTVTVPDFPPAGPWDTTKCRVTP